MLKKLLGNTRDDGIQLVFDKYHIKKTADIIDLLESSKDENSDLAKKTIEIDEIEMIE